MQTSVLPAPDERGKRWLLAKTQQTLADNAVAAGAAVCYWGTGAATGTTLYVLLAGDPEPKALPFSHGMIAQCGSGLYAAQHNAIMLIRRTLRKMGIVPA